MSKVIKCRLCKNLTSVANFDFNVIFMILKLQLSQVRRVHRRKRHHKQQVQPLKRQVEMQYTTDQFSTRLEVSDLSGSLDIRARQLRVQFTLLFILLVIIHARRNRRLGETMHFPFPPSPPPSHLTYSHRHTRLVDEEKEDKCAATNVHGCE